MKPEEFILSVVKKIESLNGGMVCFAHMEGNLSGSNKWWQVCLSDYDFYMHDARFKNLTKAWHKIGNANNFKIVFCFCSPHEKRLAELLEAGNLVIDA